MKRVAFVLLFVGILALAGWSMTDQAAQAQGEQRVYLPLIVKELPGSIPAVGQ